MTLSAAQAAALLASYDGFGLRRTGTPGDHACAQWMVDQLIGAGVQAKLARVPLDMRHVDEAALEFDGQRLDGLPLFDAPDTPVEGITASLDRFGVLDIEPGAASVKGQAFELLRKDSERPALLITTRGAAGSLAPINAQYFTAPFGPPALQVAGLHHEVLQAAAQRGAQARMVVRTHHTRGHSYNLDARTGASPRMVLLTPRTSWWESTAERAGGIIAWLHAHQQAHVRGIAVRGFSTCGHELGHLGLAQVLHYEQALLDSAPLWLHLGANLGCASDPRVTLRATELHNATRMRDQLVADGYPADAIEIEPIDRAMGEARDLAERGARVLSLIGRNGHFHAPSDRFPGNVNAAWVASVANAVSNWVDRAAPA